MQSKQRKETEYRIYAHYGYSSVKITCMWKRQVGNVQARWNWGDGSIYVLKIRALELVAATEVGMRALPRNPLIKVGGNLTVDLSPYISLWGSLLF